MSNPKQFFVGPGTERRHASRQFRTMPQWIVSAGLACGFGIWFSWAVLVVHLGQVNPSVSLSSQFSLLALVGLAGLCLRLTLGFLMPAGTEPLVLRGSLIILMLTSFGLYLALGAAAPALGSLQILAVLTGLGGGCFSVLVDHSRIGASNAAGVQAEICSGLGHLGIVVSFLVLPLIVSFELSSRDSALLMTASSHFLGRLELGQPLWLGWVGLFWGLATSLVLALSVLCPQGLSRVGWFDLVQFMVALVLGLGLTLIGAWLLLDTEPTSGLFLSRELLLVALVALALLLIRLWSWCSGAAINFQIFANRNTWVMSLFWVMSAGSFLGLAMALPLTLTLWFQAPEVALARQYPGVFLYVWMLPLSGVLVRPLGAWCARRWSSALVIQVCIVALILGALAAAFLSARIQATNFSPPYFPAVMLVFTVLFVAAGMAHAALIRSLPTLFPARQCRPVGVWLTSISALGVVYIPLVFGQQLVIGEPVQAMLGFALFYGACLMLNGWLYLGRKAKSDKGYSLKS